jgi:hypothetical protein
MYKTMIINTLRNFYVFYVPMCLKKSPSYFLLITTFKIIEKIFYSTMFQILNFYQLCT